MAWKTVPGYTNYECNHLGELRNKETGYVTKGGDAGRYLKTTVTSDKGKTKLEYMHILVCSAFHGPCPEGMVVLHKDNDRFNCKPTNLKYGTQSDNIKQVYKDNLRPSKTNNFKGFGGF